MPREADAAPVQVQDQRRAPFCYQTHTALDAVRAHYLTEHADSSDAPFGKVIAAIGVYTAITEAANRNGGAVARDGFRLQRKEIIRLTGLSERTFDRYVSELEGAGVLRVDREEVAGVNLPNVWVLLEPDSHAGVATPTTPGGDAHVALRARSLPEPKKPEEPNGSSVSKRTQPRDVLWDAVEAEIGPVATESERGRRNRALKELREIGATPEQITARCAEYRKRWPKMTLSPQALVGNWTSLATREGGKRGAEVDLSVYNQFES